MRPIGPAPLVPPAIGLMLGILVDSAWAGRPWLYLVGLGVGMLLLIVPGARQRGAVLAAVVTAACTGALLHHNAYRRVAADHVVHRVSSDQAPVGRMRGTVLTTPRIAPRATGPFAPWMYSPDRTSFLLEADSVERDGRFSPVTGRVRITVKEAVMDLAVGDRIELFGRLYRPGPPQNPGQFDWSRWQRRHGVLVGMSCNYQEAVTKLEPGPSGLWSGRLDRVRQRVRGLVLDEMLATGGPETGLLDAMVLARRTAVDPSINEAFIRIGCAHYLAVSGFHVGVLALFVYTMGRICGATRRSSAVVVMVVTVAYAVLAEPRPPILRATVLTAAACTSMLTRRRSLPLNLLALAATINLIARPTDLFDVGFQMSYACVAGLILLQAPIRAALLFVLRRSEPPLVRTLADQRKPDAGIYRRTARRAVGFVLMTPLPLFFSACLPSWPIILLTFQRFSPWAFVNTFLLLYPSALVLCVGFATLVVGIVSPWLAGGLTPLLKGTAALLLWMVAVLGSVPGTDVHIASPPPMVWVGSFYLVLLTLVGVYHQAVGPRTVVAALAALALGTAFWLIPTGRTDELRMTVLAVGRGTAVVIELPDGGAVLYDAGCSGSYDVGKTAIVPFLAHRGIGRVEAAIISHPNLDHFSGLPSVADQVEIAQVMTNPQFEELSPANKPSSVLLKEVRRMGIPLRLIDSSTPPFEIGGARFEVLWPPAELPFEPTANESSIVLRVSYAGRSILLAGDIEESAQRCLLDSGTDLTADVLVLAHHGSVRWNTSAFVEAVSPATVIRSASEPNAISLARLQPVIGNRPLYNTADDGAVEVVLDEEGIEVSGFRSGVGPSAARR